MTDDAPAAPATAMTVRPERPRVTSIQPLFDSDHFEHFQRAATALMHSTLLKESIRGPSPAACFSNLMLIFDQADRLGVPATVVAQNVDVVFGQLVYRGTLVAAVVEAKLGKLHRYYTGERGADDYRVYIWEKPFTELSADQLAALRPGKYPVGARMHDGSVAEWRTFQKESGGGGSRKPNPAWTGQATMNQLAYRGDREWCRHYEPGILLGVFSDDEVEAFESRVVSVTDLGAAADAAPIITADFAKPAASAPEASQAGAGPSGDKAPGEGAAATTAQPAAQEQAAKPKRQSAADKEAERVEQVRADTQARLAKCAMAEEIGYQDGLANRSRGIWPDTDTPFTKEEHGNYLNGLARAGVERTATKAATPAEAAAAHGISGEGLEAGSALDAIAEGEPEIVAQVLGDAVAADEDADVDARSGLALDAYEDGHAAGLAGRDGGAPRKWTEFADDYSEGWNAGAAERLQDIADGGDDPDDDDDAGAIDQASNDPPNAFEEYAMRIRGRSSWAEIKAELTALSRTDDWKGDVAQRSAFRIRSARISAWLRVVELMKDGAEAVDFTADLSAFRCWMETVEDPAMILEKWQALVASPTYAALEAQPAANFEAAVKERMRGLTQ